MKNRLFILVVTAFMAVSAYCEEIRIVSVTAMTEEVDDAPKTTFVAVEYDIDVRNATLTADAFEVKDRTITKVYANSEINKSARGTDGKFVIIELSATDAPAPTSCQETGPKKYLELEVEVQQVKNIKATDGSIIPSSKGFISSSRQINLETKN